MKKQFPPRFLRTCASLLLLLAVLTAGCNTNTESTSATTNAESGTPPKPIDMEKLMAPFAPPTQTFTVSGKKPSTVTGQKGTTLHIHPSNLQKPDGSPVTGKIEVTLIECTDKAAIIGAGLQTVSNGKLLASGGSYYIGMQSEGQELSLQPGKTLDVEFPKIEDENMELFYGERTSDGQVNWVETSLPFEEKVLSDSSKQSASESTYVFISSTDSAVSTSQDDIWAYIEGYEEGGAHSSKPKPTGNREADNIAAMNARREQAEREEKRKKAQEKTTQLYAKIGLNRMGWINCDRYLNQPQSVEIALETNSTGNPVIGHIVLRDINSIIAAHPSPDPNKLFPQSLPIGQEVEIICLSQDPETGDYAFAAQKLTVKENTTLHLDLKPATPTEIKKALNTI